MASHAIQAVDRGSISARELLAQKLREKAAGASVEYPLSDGQSALWFLYRMAPRSPAYNVAFVARVISTIDVDALERALQRLIDRHGSLRTTFAERDGELRQVIHGAMDLGLKRVDASKWSEEELRARVCSAFAEPYDLERGPVFRALLYSRAVNDHVLLFGIHHIATDGWSQGILLRELQELYAAYTQGRPADLPPVGMSYGETVKRRADMLRSDRGRRLWEYWEQTLGGDLPILDLPADRPRPAKPSMQGDSCPFRIDEASYQQLKSLARAEGVTFYTLVLAALQVLLMRYTGKRDILVGTPMAARTEAAFENTVGYFMNSVVIRGDLSGEPTFREFLARLRERVLGALSHQDFPFFLLVKRLCPEREASRSPVFQVMFNLQSRQTLGPFADLLAGEESAEPVNFGGMLLKPFHLAQGAGAFDLILELIDTGRYMDGLLMFAVDIFDAETVARMGQHFSTLLGAIAADPDRRITELPILPDAERRRLTDGWHQTAMAFPRDRLVHHLVREQAEKTPDAVAVTCEHRSLTYRALVEEAARLALHLQALGVRPGRLVGIFLERSVEMAVAILAVLEAGGAYVPLDPAFPAERLAAMLEDAGCQAVLTDESLSGVLPSDTRNRVVLDEIRLKQRSPVEMPLVRDESAEDLAYVIYTSGSTGRPKGVEVPHRALVNFLLSMQREPGITPNDVLLSVTTVSFDIFGLELFLPLISGARTTLVGREVAADGVKLRRAIERSGATLMQATPATWRLLLESGWRRASGLKVLCGGEALTRDLADRILDTGAELWNMYGPTETTIWSAAQRITKGSGPISIGKPIANTRLYVMTAPGELAPIGVPGELWIGGDGLARGYHNRSDLTARSFVADPWANGGGARLYRTGDLVRRSADGSIQFLGRIDNQVKIRGYRIELGDIESHLGQHPAIKDSVVVVREDTPNHKRLIAYYVPSGNMRPSAKELREYLAVRLPDYMVPAAYVGLDAFPLTPNGKIDRKALPQPELAGSSGQANHVGPRDAAEGVLVEIWRSVLGQRSVSVHDSFFALGGDSLLAARMFAEVERKTGRNIPLAVLFQSPTIAGLAQALRSSEPESSWPLLVPIHTEGDRPPLFLVHGAEGNVLLYRSLQRYLGEDQPVYGLQSEGLDGRADFHPTIESMAAAYVEAMRTIQPHGPYYLGGYCMGGTVAFEMARQLQVKGERIALLAMFESYHMNGARISRRPAFWLTYHIQNVLFHVLNALSLRGDERVAFVREKLHTALTRLGMRKDALIARMKRSESGNRGSYYYVRVKQANDAANEDYRAREYRGRITLFRAAHAFAVYSDPHFGWKGIPTEGIEMHVFPFYPRAMLTEPFVRDLAQRLKAIMLQGAAAKAAVSVAAGQRPE